jgi:hypothetical protein
MAVFPITQLRKMRPNWCPIHDAGVEILQPGDTVERHYHDSAEFLFVVEGRVSVDFGGESVPVETGEVVLLETGCPHAITEVHEPTAILWLRDSAQPPFRSGNLRVQDGRGPRFVPKRPPPSPGLTAHEISLDLEATFVPEQLRRAGHGDLVLRAHPGVLGQSQVKEVRRLLVELDQALVFFCVDVADEEIDTFFFDKVLRANLEALPPRGLCVRGDLAREEAGPRVELLRDHWLPVLRRTHTLVCLDLPLRRWTREEQMRMAARLAALPPLHWRVVLDWDEAAFKADPFGARDMIEAMMPWLIAIRCEAEGSGTIRHMVEGLGFQGWIVSRPVA